MSDNTFDCCGKVASACALPGSSLLLRAHLNPILFPPSLTAFPQSTTHLFGSPQPSSTGILHLKHFLKLMEMKMRILNRFENAEKSPTPHFPPNSNLDYFHLRKEIVDFVVYIRNYFYSVQPHLQHLQHPPMTELKTGFDEVLFSLRKFLSRLKNVTLHHLSSNVGNRCPQPSFHLFHLHLELRWLMITLLHQQTLQENSQNQNERLDRTLELVIQDLVFIALKNFQRIETSDLRLKSPFTCSCVRDFWLVLQNILEKISDKLGGRNFWSYVNGTLDKAMRSDGDNLDMELSWSAGHKCENFDYKLETKSPEIFSLWMIYHLTLLYNYDKEGNYNEHSGGGNQSNYHELEKILKSFLDKGGKEGERDEIDEELRTMIPLLRALVLDFQRDRESSVRIISSLWDCFHRRLDQPFLVQTAGPWSVSLDKKSPADILRQIRSRISGENNPKESSFGMFLKLLGIILKENKKEMKVWNQIRGRVFSKFSKNKVQEFSEVRLFNLISLLLTLGLSADAESVVKVMVDLLPNPLNRDDDQGRRACLSFKAHLCCLLVLMENRLDVKAIGEKLTDIVGILSTKRDEIGRSMMGVFVETLSEAFSKVELLETGEHCLIGGWVDRYLLECPKPRAGPLLKMLYNLLTKSRALNIGNPSSGKDMLEALWFSAAARIRGLVYDTDLTDENCEDIGKIAAIFTLEAMRCPKMAENHKHSAPSLFRHFTSTTYVRDVKISRVYISIILENRGTVNDMKKLVNTFDLVVIQVWIKCSIFGMDASPVDMKTIKNYVVDLEEMSKIFPSWKESLDFKNSKESLILFVTTLSKHRSSLSEAERVPLDQRVRLMFASLDKWALQPIKDDNLDSGSSLFIYRCLGTIILNCAPMLYTPATTNVLRILITKFMLPGDDSLYLRTLGKKIFPMVIPGLEALNQTSPREDHLLPTLIVDLFNTYLPLLITEAPPDSRNFRIADQLMTLFKELTDQFLQYILDKLCGNYLTIEHNELRKNSYLLLELVRGLLREESSRKPLIKVIGGRVLKGVIEVFLKLHDHHPHRRQTLDLIKELCENELYRGDVDGVRRIVRGVVAGVVCGRVGEMPKACFGFLRGLVNVKVDPELIQGMVERLERIVREAEKAGRVYAASLRYALKQFSEFWGRDPGKQAAKL